ncbi:hypothetical protein F4777DRAFT_577430 [Nemania sp. FL0916]|nr:hypothetical protein F4777DRAFT_577430 [Nemania sp. FL0916]
MAKLPEASISEQSIEYFGRIEIWRHEVATSRICCVCSAPTLPDKGASLRRNAWSTKLSLTTRSLNKGMARLFGRDETGAPPLARAATSGSEREGGDAHKPASSKCLGCGKRVCGVAYKRLSLDEFGLVWTRSSPPATTSSTTESTEVCEQQQQKRGRADKNKAVSLLKKVSQRFSHDARLDLPSPRSNKSGELIAGPERQSTNLNSLLDALNVSVTAITTVGPQNKSTGKYGTEMYRNLRSNNNKSALGHDGEVESVFSDDDDLKKPKLGIEKSAERLRRAQRLLERNR